jgi:L-ascorbate metabolism protein UlaG (beta-lactamase superfamily)
VLEHYGIRIVLDLGYGTLPRLFDFTGSSVGEGIDAVVVTHEHPDHMVDPCTCSMPLAATSSPTFGGDGMSLN